MDVNEVIGLVRWLERYVSPAMPAYEEIANALEQNASQNNKVALRDTLDSVRDALTSMPVEKLTYEQTDLLNRIGALELVGEPGWKFVERTVKEGNFDPVSAATDTRKAKKLLERTVSLFTSLRSALSSISITGDLEHEVSGKVTARIRFQGAANIGNVTQLKKWSSEWYDIARGLAMAVGESPEDVEVKGASTGSVIIILSTTLAVATMLALILKQAALMVKSGAEIANTIEDFRMKRIMNKEIEEALKNRKTEIEKGGAQEALTLVKENIGNTVAGETENGLKKAIDKVFKFSADGGEVDMLPPSLPTSSDETDQVAKAIRAITSTIEETRSLKAATQLLIEDQSGRDG